MTRAAYLEYIDRLEEKSGKLFVALAMVEHALERGDADAARKHAREGRAAFYATRAAPTNPATLVSLGHELTKEN